MADKKERRLQLRMTVGLKKWFGNYARSRGGMSNIIREHVEDLYTKSTGLAWDETDDRQHE